MKSALYHLTAGGQQQQRWALHVVHGLAAEGFVQRALKGVANVQVGGRAGGAEVAREGA